MKLFFKIVFPLFILTCLALGIYLVYLDRIVVREFEGKRFSIPAKVYARPLELFTDNNLSAKQMIDELNSLGYKRKTTLSEPGDFSHQGNISQTNVIDVYLRSFRFWDGQQSEKAIRVTFFNRVLEKISSLENGENIDLIRIEPQFIGGIYPNQGEDRELIRLNQSPVRLLESLLIIEDKRFYQHIGIDPRGIARALYRSASGKRVEGGSTITQQLIKNFFLTSERSLKRKFNEILMAILVELRYEKNDILETYLNEVYLGQDGNRAIHGFGLASRFYFNKDIESLLLHESALLVAMLKGPTFYNPRKSPERALKRRNLVISQLADNGLIDYSSAEQAQQRTLGVATKKNIGQSSYPAFLELVVKQLKRDYEEEDLRSEGLRVFTTLDPTIQNTVESIVKQRIGVLKKSSVARKDLETAVIITDTSTAEVQALVGSQNTKYSGFNRALDAQRQIGSLVKPAVYMSAIEQTQHYSLLSVLDDSPLTLQQAGTNDWTPQNYDKTFHGNVPLWLAFAKSYNVPAVRLGLEVGVDKTHHMLRRLGLEKELTEHASSLLGSMELSPLEVTQIYQTLSSGGFYIPLRSIREVTQQDGTALNRYKIKLEQRLSKELSYLTTRALQNVVTLGTGQSLQRYLNKDLAVAAKTGTSDDLRDSWFAGYTQDKLGVVWIGNDDNSPTDLTGATGALPVWGDIFSAIPTKKLAPTKPGAIGEIHVDPKTMLVSEGCRGSFSLPFILGDKSRIVNPASTQTIKHRYQENQYFLSKVCKAKDGQAPAKKSWFRKIFGE